MKWGSLFIGRHEELTRPVYPVDQNLMVRIAQAKQRLAERNIEPVALLRVKQPVALRRVKQPVALRRVQPGSTNPGSTNRRNDGSAQALSPRFFSPRLQSPAA
jgi:hypothetical protein